MSRKPPRSTEERLARWQRSMTPGTLGGRVASASPMALDTSRLDPRLRTQKRPLGGGGFDPNADPVVIGSGATAGTFATTSVAVGLGATVNATGTTAVGTGADAEGSDSTALGENATTSGARDIAVGYGSSTSSAAPFGGSPGVDNIAIGRASTAGSDNGDANCVAIGQGAKATKDTSVAIGWHATTTKVNQIMLGTTSTFVEIPGNSGTAPNGLVLTDTATGTRYIIRITSGALVLSAAP